MDKLNDKIAQCKMGNKEVLEEILIMMTPLIKKYASKTYFMEREDATQEYYMILLQCIKSMEIGRSDPEYLRYMETAVEHHYIRLSAKNYTKMQEIDIDDYEYVFSDPKYEQEFSNIEFKCSMEKLKKRNYKKWMIMTLSMEANMNSAEISRILGVSRQYVNQEKKKLLEEFKKYVV